MENTWPVVFFSVATLSQRMSMLPLQLSRPKGVSSLLTGVPRDSRSVSTTSLQLLSQEVISLKLHVLCACCQTLQLSQKLGQDLITSLTLCMPRELSFIGMLEKEWKKVSSLKLEKILLL